MQPISQISAPPPADTKKAPDMVLEFSLAHLTMLDLSPTDMVEVAARTGYDYVGFRLTPVVEGEQVFPLLTDNLLRKKVKKQLSKTGVRVLDIELVRLGPSDDPVDYVNMLEVGADLGARHVLCQVPDTDQSRAADHFARLCELARPLNLTVDLEFPSWTETANIGDASSIVTQANCDGAGIVVDILHFARSNSTLEQLRKVPREWIHYVQLCDADAAIPATVDGLIHAARCDRNFPGQGGINVREIVGAMPRVPYALEIPNDRLRAALGNEDYARQAIEIARCYLSRDDRKSSLSSALENQQ